MSTEVDVCDESELADVDRKRVQVDGRSVLIVNHKGTLYALDKLCYHKGGPLYLGDIEEVGDRVCIVCPMHKHRICLDNGESIVKNVGNTESDAAYKSRGIKQRVHGVRTSQGRVHVTLSDLSVPVASDTKQV